MMASANETRVLIMAGGTGGHVYPALATAKALQGRGCTVQWLGTQKGIEAKLVPDHGIVLNLLTITGIRGKGVAALVGAPIKIMKAIMEARSILKKYAPHVVLGMGGYVSGPGGVAANLLGIPLVIHEQNARAGTTNKMLAKIATRVLVAFPNALPGGVSIGNPVREEILSIAEPRERFKDRNGPIRLLILGGSLGARAINSLIPATLGCDELRDRFEVVHQSGPKLIDEALACYQQHQLKGQVLPYIDDIAKQLAWADLVICRAGALTVTELSIVGIGAILIPYPYAIDDHQTANAMWLKQCGGAIVKQQSELDEAVLKKILLDLCSNRENLLAMAEASRAAASPDATLRCADACLEVANV